MKYYLIIACISFLTLTNCSLDSVRDTQPTTYRILWHLKNVSGGVEDADIDFPANKIIWEFVGSNIEVNNTNTDTSIQDGLDTGIYPFEVIKVGENIEYLKINSVEVGKVTFNSDGTQLTINQNEKSTGAVEEDGYIFTFDKVLILVN
jgi:hypothetical protein